MSNPLGGGSIFAGIQDIGSAVSDLYAAKGDMSEAGQYSLAENYALEEAKFTESSTNIKEMQTARQLQMATGGIQAGYAGNGLKMSGSAQDVLRESAQQGALTTAAIGFQGKETELGFQEQATSYSVMADAAKTAAKGADIAAGIQGVAAAVNFASAAAGFGGGGDGVLPGGTPLGQGGIGHM